MGGCANRRLAAGSAQQAHACCVKALSICDNLNAAHALLARAPHAGRGLPHPPPEHRRRAAPASGAGPAWRGRPGWGVLHVTAGEFGEELLLRSKPVAALARPVVDEMAATLPAGSGGAPT